MGKATRWFKSLLGLKKSSEKEKEKEKEKDRDSDSHTKRWSFGGKSVKPPPESSVSASDAAWLRSYIAGSGADQNKHAIAVAAATAAAADAAVAAAQAAVAVVRLTTHAAAGNRHRWAAAKIQAVFRGFLARKALRALKGLVKIQALVRGFLVRKRTAATLYSMQALIRAQTAVRTHRARRSSETPRKSTADRESHSKRLSGSFTDNNNNGGGFDYDSPKIVEIDTYRPRSSSRSRSRRFECSGENPISSPLIFTGRNRISAVPECHECYNYYSGDYCRFSTTAHSTPRFAAPATPAKSVCGVAGGDWRSYMASTESFSAKLRSQSAPRQRPEKKRLSLNEILAARNSVSGVRMHKSPYSLFQEPSFHP